MMTVDFQKIYDQTLKEITQQNPNDDSAIGFMNLIGETAADACLIMLKNYHDALQQETHKEHP